MKAVKVVMDIWLLPEEVQGVAEIEVKQVVLVSVSSAGRVMVNLRRDGTGAATAKGLLTCMFNTEAESSTN